jgi:hypothetical protein
MVSYILKLLGVIMLLKIISGAQNGVDQAALAVAKMEGFETGGTMPYGFRTLDGPRRDLAEEYNLSEHSRPDYPPRTYQNVRDSDATLRIYNNPNSLGEICTLRAIHHYNKAYFDIDLRSPPAVDDVVDWLRNKGVHTLNVAGNSEKTCPGIFQEAAQLLHQILRAVRKAEELDVKFTIELSDSAKSEKPEFE